MSSSSLSLGLALTILLGVVGGEGARRLRLPTMFGSLGLGFIVGGLRVPALVELPWSELELLGSLGLGFVAFHGGVVLRLALHRRGRARGPRGRWLEERVLVSVATVVMVAWLGISGVTPWALVLAGLVASIVVPERGGRRRQLLGLGGNLLLPCLHAYLGLRLALG